MSTPILRTLKKYTLPSIVAGGLAAPLLTTAVLLTCQGTFPDSYKDSAWCKWHSPLTKDDYTRGRVYFAVYFPLVALAYLFAKHRKTMRAMIKERS